MELLETIAASGGPAGILAGILIAFLKKESRQSHDRHDANDQKWNALSSDVKALKSKAESVQSDLGDIKIQIAKISTAVDLMVIGKAEKTN